MHTVILVFHAAAHETLRVVIPSILDSVFIGLAMFLAPIASVILLRRRPRIAQPLLFFSMLASFAYGAISHYLLPTPDNVAFVATAGWGLVFHGTTAALALVESAAIVLAAMLLLRSRRALPTVASFSS